LNDEPEGRGRGGMEKVKADRRGSQTGLIETFQNQARLAVKETVGGYVPSL
jgi:hypothetical protein